MLIFLCGERLGKEVQPQLIKEFVHDFNKG
jgi:hypothetical protein